MLRKTIYLGSPAYLSKKLDQLHIRRIGADGVETVDTVPIEDIGMVILDCPQLTLTVPLLTALLERAAVITCDDRHLPYGVAIPLYGHTTYQEHLRAQLDASAPRKKQLWQFTVKAKLSQQAGLLEEVGFNGEPLRRWSRQVRSGDPDNLEARGAAYYWKQLFGDEEAFVRGRDEAPPNNLLNYGYAILRATVARALVASGLSPSIGIFHRSKYNPLCLADDIMEPYRPYVDGIVVDLESRYGSAPEQLEHEHKRQLLSLPTIDTYFEGRKSPLSVAVQRTTASLARALKGEATNISYPTWTP